MPITLNHTIVPARDKEAAARFFARIFGLAFDNHFAPVRVNETLTFLFDNKRRFRESSFCLSRERHRV
jgi:predicted enzyme related to lactoylglutathione lyase